MMLTENRYDVVFHLGYKDELVIEDVELVDLLSIIPVFDKIKHRNLTGSTNLEIIIRKAKSAEDVET